MNDESSSIPLENQFRRFMSQTCDSDPFAKIKTPQLSQRSIRCPVLVSLTEASELQEGHFAGLYIVP